MKWIAKNTFSRIRSFPSCFELCLCLMNFHHFPPFWHRVRDVFKCDKLVMITLFGIYLVNKMIKYDEWRWICMPENCGFLHNWRMKINFSKQKSFKKSVFHRLVNLFTMRFLCLIVRAWDCPQNRETWEVCSWMGGGLSNALTNLCMALYCHKNSVQKYKNKEQKIQWKIKQSHA